MDSGTIYAESDGQVYGVAVDGTSVILGGVKRDRRGYAVDGWLTLDAATIAYLRSHPTPEDW